MTFWQDAVVPPEKVRPLRRAFSVTRLNKLLVRALGDRAEVRVQAPFGASDVSEPEPDLAIVARGDYLQEHPSRAFLLIEVADSSLQDDRRIKGPLYAAVAVPEYWIVDVVAGVVEVHRDPRAEGYASVTRHGREAVLTVPGFEDVVVRVSDVVPPRMPAPRRSGAPTGRLLESICPYGRRARRRTIRHKVLEEGPFGPPGGPGDE